MFSYLFDHALHWTLQVINTGFSFGWLNFEWIYIVSIDSWKGPKRLLEFQSCAAGKQKASQIEKDGAEAKRQRRASGDDFEEFVALLEKIQYMKTFHGNFGIWEEVSMRQDSDMKVMKSKSPWIPSFEWEDFSGFAAKDTIKRISADHFNTTYSSYDKRPAESFDLNVEASSNQKISAGF